MNAITLEQVEGMAAQLLPQEQLQLLARISERLSQLIVAQETTAEERQRREYAARVEAFLAACDAVAEQIEGDFDSAADLRQIREERTERI